MQHAIISRISEDGYLAGEIVARVKHEYAAGESKVFGPTNLRKA